MQQSSKIIFFGTEDFSASALTALLNANFPVAAVITKPDSKRGRSQKITEPAVKTIAVKHGIPVLQPEKIVNIETEIKKLNPTHGVLVSFGKIIPQSTIELFAGGIINVHPSLLPKYRGPSPIETAILNGDKITGISLMLLTAKMDAGPVFAQKTVDLAGNEDRISLYLKLATLGAEFLVEKLGEILSGALIAKPQDESRATYVKLLTKQDGVINWDEPANQIERKIRAYAGFPKSQTTLHNQNVIITKVRLAKSSEDGALVIKCSPGWLEILQLIGPSGKTMSGSAFLHGYKKVK